LKHYQHETAEVLAELSTSRDGLSESAVAEREAKYGPNRLAEGKKKSIFLRIWGQISDPMVLVLIGAAILSGAFHEIADMCIILVVVVLNTVLGIFQESKAEKAIEALQKMSLAQTRVRRGGVVTVIPSEQLVPGDIVIMEAGDAVPADMRIIDAVSLKIEEAALTGESVPAEKQTAALMAEGEKDVPLGDRTCMAYMGTSVSYGRAEGVVTAIGMDTEIGKIATILASNEEEATPLQKKLAGLSKVLSIAVLGICAFIFIFTVIRNGGFSGGHVFEALLTAISLAVAAIPEGLVVVVTVLLSIGVTRMSSRNAIIRRLTAVETLGCTQVICSDKTGTLTQNKMTVVEHFGSEHLLAEAMFFCNDVEVTTEEGEVKYIGDPTQIAQKEFGMRYSQSEHKRIGELPFDSSRKMMSTIHDYDGSARQYTTGAPDVILSFCDTIAVDGNIVPLTDELRESVTNANRAMAAKALRVLGAAMRDYDALPDMSDTTTLECNMTFLGLTGIIDPVRPEVKLAIAECNSAGIRPIMITGDHKDTAIAIASELGILTDASQAITGSELDDLSDEVFEKVISDIVVYARVQPQHKVRIVEMWRKKGKITAMTGDGVNDAPAIKTADIGVGMGITGTDVTKNVSDMVLSDDNFASIVYAVEEGRRIYENIRKAIQYLLSANLSEVISIFFATLVGKQLFLPIHILWINLVTDTFPAMALGMEPAEPDVMKKPPRDPNATIFAAGLGSGTIIDGILISILTLTSFFIGEALDHASGMTMAFLTLSLCEVFHALNMRSRGRSIFKLKTHNKYLVGAMILSFLLTLAVMYIPGVNTVFSLEALDLKHFGIGLGCAFAIIPLVEIEKFITHLFKKK